MPLVPPSGNSGEQTPPKPTPPAGKPFVKGDSRINRRGRPHLAKAVRMALRQGSPRIVEALIQLVEHGGEEIAVRGTLGLQLLEAAWGKAGVDGWMARRTKGEAGSPAASSETDLSDEIRHAREKHQRLREQLDAMGEEASPALLKAEAEAADLVRRLCATQAEYHPGSDTAGDFTVTVAVEGTPEPDGPVPDLVADRQVDDAPVAVTQEVATAPAGTGNPLVDAVDE